jgi:hypothetical protein
MENFNQPHFVFAATRRAPSKKDQLHPFSQPLFITTFQVVHGSTLNAGNPMDQFSLGSDLHLDDPLHPIFKNQKFFTGLSINERNPTNYFSLGLDLHQQACSKFLSRLVHLFRYCQHPPTSRNLGGL